MSVLLALIAGVLSFLSPCVLPLVPVYLGYLSGAAITPQGLVASRRTLVAHALAFVAGFTVIFVMLWSALAVLTVIFTKTDLARIGGVLLIIFGIHFTGIVRIPLLYREARVEVRHRRVGYFTSLLTGMAFAAGWTPCVGPTLAGVIALATQEATVWQGTALLLVYAAGLGAPFVLTAFAWGSAMQWFKRLKPHLRYIELASGTLLLAMGLLLVTDNFQRLNAIFFQLTPEWLFRFL